MKEVDEVESSNALACWVEPSVPISSILPVGSNTLSWLPELEVWVVITLLCLSSSEDDLELFNSFHGSGEYGATSGVDLDTLCIGGLKSTT